MLKSKSKTPNFTGVVWQASISSQGEGKHQGKGLNINTLSWKVLASLLREPKPNLGRDQTLAHDRCRLHAGCCSISSNNVGDMGTTP